MSGTGESTGNFDDDQRGNTTDPAPEASAGQVFAEIAGGTAMPEEVAGGTERPADPMDANAADPDTSDPETPDHD